MKSYITSYTKCDTLLNDLYQTNVPTTIHWGA